MCALLARIAIVLAALAPSRPTAAAEYGVSTYRLGIMDLSAGFLPPPGGTIAKGLFMYQDAHLDARSTDGKVAVNGHTGIYAAAIFVAHTTGLSLLGTNWGFGALLPSMIIDQSLQIGPPGIRVPAQTSTVGGVGEFQLAPIMLNWNLRRLHLSGALFFYSPTGSYDSERVANTGLNRWALEPDVSATWLDEQTGLEASAMIGYTISAENPATDYRSGDEFHADYVLAERFRTGTIVGATGYALQQTTADTGPGAAFGAFRSRVLALGPLIGQTIRFGELPISFTFKYDFEFAAQNYATGNELWLTAALPI